MPDALLFDLDRTLIDLQSFTDYAAARREAEALALDTGDVEVPETDWEADTTAVMALLVACAGEQRWGQVSAAVAVHERAAIPRSVAMPGLAEAWRLAERLPRAVVTLLPEDVAREVLGAHGIDDPALVVVGRTRDHRPKPAPDGLLAACAAVGVPPARCVMIGDSTWDRAAAEAAGMAFVGVPTEPAALPPGTTLGTDLVDGVRRALAG